MIEAVTLLALFGLVYHFNRCETYKILLVAAIANVIVYPFTSEYSAFLEGTINAVALFMLIDYGDRDRRFQTILLSYAFVCCLVFEAGQLIDNGMIIYGYGSVVTAITIMQLLGGGYAVVLGFLGGASNYNRLGVLRNHFNTKMGDKACQKEQQKH